MFSLFVRTRQVSASSAKGSSRTSSTTTPSLPHLRPRHALPPRLSSSPPPPQRIPENATPSGDHDGCDCRNRGAQARSIDSDAGAGPRKARRTRNGSCRWASLLERHEIESFMYTIQNSNWCIQISVCI